MALCFAAGLWSAGWTCITAATMTCGRTPSFNTGSPTSTHTDSHMTQVCVCVTLLSSRPRRKLFVSSRPSGFPQSFQTRAEVSQFVTMIIFSCSALHAAVNFSQVGLQYTASEQGTHTLDHCSLTQALIGPSLCPPAGLQSLDAKLSACHVASSSKG